MLEQKGYPFKSKEHSKYLSIYQNSGVGKSVRLYLGIEGHKMRVCPNVLKYQFTEDFKMKVSDKCCSEMKKKPFHKWQKENGKTIAITGMRKEEGGQRKGISCIVTGKDNKVEKFHPLAPVSEKWLNWFIDKEKIQLAELYYPPYNFERTGCKGCPYSLGLQRQLDVMAELLPAERKQCEIIWKPVYEEYRRVGFRLEKDDGQLTIFDFLERN